MSEDKKYQRKGHVHTDMKKESKTKGTHRVEDWWCIECNDYTPYDFNHTCTVCSGRMIWI